MNAANRPLLYLDHNVLDALLKEKLRIDKFVSGNFIVVYSDENLLEIERSNELNFLELLKRLRAFYLSVNKDDKFRLLDTASIREGHPIDDYQRYLDAKKGASNTELIASINEDFSQILQLGYESSKDGQLASVMRRSIARIQLLPDLLKSMGADQALIDKLERDIQKIKLPENIQDANQVDLRNDLGINVDLTGLDPANAIRDIWEIIGKKMHGVTLDQWFGFDPIDKQGYLKFPIVLKISSGYFQLNKLGYWPDKNLKDARKMRAHMSDYGHVSNAAFCSEFITYDKRCWVKASAIYSYLGVSCQAILYE